MHGKLSFVLSPAPKVQYLRVFDIIVECLDPVTKLNLASTNATMYNLVNHNVIRWWNGSFHYDLYREGSREKYVPLSDEAMTREKSHVSNFTVFIEGPRIGFVDSEEAGWEANTICKRETTMVLYNLCQLKAVNKIKKLIFYNMDMLAPEMIALTRGQPFELKEIQFLKCREFTMQRAAECLQGFQIGMGQLKITYLHEVPSLSWLKGTDVGGVVLSSMYYWRAHKSQPLIQNFKHNERFRSFVETLTSGSADEWYDFVNRDQGDDDDADLQLLNAYNTVPLVVGSNALNMQEKCFTCDLVMPGLCYPKARRNTDMQRSVTPA